MTLKDLFLSQPDREGATTRKAVERAPEGRNSFKPPERSIELGYLASLVAGMPGGIAFMIDRDELELDKPGSEAFGTKAVGSRTELVESLDAGIADARRALESKTDDHLLTPAPHYDLRFRLQPSCASSWSN